MKTETTKPFGSERDYDRVACRGIAAGTLSVLLKTLDEFRTNAESAGIHVNEDVVEIKKRLDRIGTDIYRASWDDRHRIRKGEDHVQSTPLV